MRFFNVDLEEWGKRLERLLQKPNVLHQYNGVRYYQDKIKNECGEALEYFIKLMEKLCLDSGTKVVSFPFSEWYSSLNNPESYLWRCVALQCNRKGADFCERLYKRDWGKYLKEVEMMELDKQQAEQDGGEWKPQRGEWKVLYWYNEVSNKYEYKLLKEVCAYIEENNKFLILTPIESKLLGGMLFLYVALENELERIREEADIDGVKLPQAPIKGIKVHTGEGKQQDGELILPDELNNDTAKNYFEEAIKYKLMDKNYKWLSTKALLAQFAFEMSMKLELNKAMGADGQRYASWKPFEQLFGYTKLRDAYNDCHKTGALPKGIDNINKIFDL